MIGCHKPDLWASPLEIRSIVRRMRGGSQSFLIKAADGNFYVVKFAGNPQGNRTLINEIISYKLLCHLGVSTPQLRVLCLPESGELREHVYFHVGNGRTAPQGSVHLGSFCPVNPETVAIFDILPERMHSHLMNLEDFATMFVFDRWLYNADKRQAVYYRDRSQTGNKKYKAAFIDHGMTFGGSAWEFKDVALHGKVVPSSACSLLDMSHLSNVAIHRICSIPEEIIFSAANGVPSDWFSEGDKEHLAEVLGKLEKRRQDLSKSITIHLRTLNLMTGNATI